MKVAAYCRVSTDKEDQANSFDSQKLYFRNYIKQQPNWILHDIYADEGISGTSTKKRIAFNRMIEDAKQNRFDCIITKEVSRFSRNILDTISFTRDLKQLGVAVIFMNDGINTLEPDAELRLAIMGSLAQEESRRTSSRVKWGQTRRMEQGVVFGRSLLGYDVNKGKMTINPDGAFIVKLIFHKYTHEHKGTGIIAKELTEAGYCTLTGSTHWQNSVILKIIRNEKYCGDLKQKKTITTDYLTHQKKVNDGKEAFVYIINHHEPIISRKVWEDTQQEIARRSLVTPTHCGRGNRYLLSGKITCHACKKPFVSRKRKRSDGTTYRTWRCATAVSDGRQHYNTDGSIIGCNHSFQLRDDKLIEQIRAAIIALDLDRTPLIAATTQIVMDVFQSTTLDLKKNVETIKNKALSIQDKKESVLDAFFSQLISEHDMALMNAKYDQELTKLDKQLDHSKAAVRSSDDFPTSMETLQATLTDIMNCKIAPDSFYCNLLKGITVYSSQQVGLRF